MQDTRHHEETIFELDSSIQDNCSKYDPYLDYRARLITSAG